MHRKYMRQQWKSAEHIFRKDFPALQTAICADSAPCFAAKMQNRLMMTILWGDALSWMYLEILRDSYRKRSASIQWEYTACSGADPAILAVIKGKV